MVTPFGREVIAGSTPVIYTKWPVYSWRVICLQNKVKEFDSLTGFYIPEWLNRHSTTFVTSHLQVRFLSLDQAKSTDPATWVTGNPSFKEELAEMQLE